MANTTRDIREFYPLMASQADIDCLPGLAELLACVLDARLSIRIGYVDDSVRRSMFRIRLLSVSSAEATFSIDGLECSGGKQVKVPVFYGRDNADMGAYERRAGWLVLEHAAVLDLASVNVLLHPDCLYIEQITPSLSLIARPYAGWRDDSEQLQAPNAAAWPKNGYAIDALSFTDGCNVKAVYSDVTGTLTFTGAPGAGTGYVSPERYVDGDDLRVDPTLGLRSVNGMQSSCIISSDGTVGIAATADEHGVVVTVSVK